ncbi:MAG: tRNA (guanosine(46)-N7)-methyltransferase TrmB [Bdellovibrionota bacterium]
MVRPSVAKLGTNFRSYVDEPHLLSKEKGFPDLFGNKNPVSIEIGMGKGLFMHDIATDHPHRNFLGIEKVKKFLLLSASRMDKSNLNNVKLFSVDAKEFIEKEIPESSVNEFFILFPDPWPKRRHRRRRMVQKDFLLLLKSKLVSKGVIHITTDHKSYFQWIEEVTASLMNTDFCEIPSQRGPYITNFQRKYEAEGRPIYYKSLQSLP